MKVKDIGCFSWNLQRAQRKPEISGENIRLIRFYDLLAPKSGDGDFHMAFAIAHIITRASGEVGAEHFIKCHTRQTPINDIELIESEFHPNRVAHFSREIHRRWLCRDTR